MGCRNKFGMTIKNTKGSDKSEPFVFFSKVDVGVGLQIERVSYT